METTAQIKPAQFKFSRIIKYLSILIPLAIAGNIIYIIVGTKYEILSELKNFSIFYLGLAVILAFVPWVTQTLALILWSGLFKKKLAASQAIKTVLATEVGGAVAPIVVGGGYVKLGLLLNYGFSAGEATMITLLGTIADGVFFFLTLPVALLISGAWQHPVIKLIKINLAAHWHTAAIIVSGIIVMILIAHRFLWKNDGAVKSYESTDQNRKVSFWQKAQRFFTDLFNAAMFVIRNGKATFAVAVGILGIGWCCRYCAISALVLGLGYHADPILFFLLQWVVFSAASLIPSPGGIGSAELSFALVYNGLVPSGIIPILTGAWRFITFYMIIILDSLILAYMGFGSPRKKAGDSLTQMTEEISD